MTFALRRERPALERDRERDRRAGGDAGLLTEAADQVLEVAGGLRPHLEDVAGLAGDAVAVLDLGEVGDPIGEVVGLRGSSGVAAISAVTKRPSASGSTTAR